MAVAGLATSQGLYRIRGTVFCVLFCLPTETPCSTPKSSALKPHPGTSGPPLQDLLGASKLPLLPIRKPPKCPALPLGGDPHCIYWYHVHVCLEACLMEQPTSHTGEVQFWWMLTGHGWRMGTLPFTPISSPRDTSVTTTSAEQLGRPQREEHSFPLGLCGWGFIPDCLCQVGV